MFELIRPPEARDQPAGLAATEHDVASPHHRVPAATPACLPAERAGRLLDGAILRTAPDAIVAIDGEGRVVEWNPAAERILGYSRDQALGRPIAELIIPEGRREDHGWGPARDPSAVRSSPAGLRVEVEAMRADGSTFPAELTVTAASPRGASPMSVAYLRDVSERRRDEDALRASEARLQTVLDSSEAVAYLKDLDGRYLLINRRWAELFNVTKRGVVGRTDRDVFPAPIADAFRANDLRALEAGRAIEMEEIAPHVDGPHTYLSIKVPLYDPSGAPYATCGISTDITARKRMEEALREGEATLRSFYDSTPLLMGVVELEGDDIRLVSINAATAGVLGQPVEGSRGRLASRLGIAPDELGLWVGRCRRVWAEGRAVRFEETRGEGEDRSWHVAAIGPIAASAPDRPRFSFVVEDVSERRRAEELLRQGEERFRRAFDSSAVGMALLAPDGRWVWVNRSLCEIVGLSEDELLATTFRDITHPDDVDTDPELTRGLLAGEIPSFQVERRYLHKLGHPIWVLTSVSMVRDADGRPVHLVAQLKDITARKRAEERLAERVRLAELGSEVGVSLTLCATMREMLRRCAESLVRHLDVALARIWLLDPGGETLELQAGAGVDDRIDGPDGRIPVGRFVIGGIARGDRPRVIDAVDGDPGASGREGAVPKGPEAFAGFALMVDPRRPIRDRRDRPG